MTEKAIQLGEFIQKAREAKGYSIRQVERETGISNAYLGQIEKGQVQEPSPSKLLKLSECLGVSYQSLMEHAGYMMPKVGTQSKPSNANAMLLIEQELTKDEADALQDFLKTLRKFNSN